MPQVKYLFFSSRHNGKANVPLPSCVALTSLVFVIVMTCYGSIVTLIALSYLTNSVVPFFVEDKETKKLVLQSYKSEVLCGGIGFSLPYCLMRVIISFTTQLVVNKFVGSSWALKKRFIHSISH